MTDEELKDIQVSKDSEFFIAVAKQDIHSFLMLGVMKDNAPIVLARVGKTNDIDENYREFYKILGKVIFSSSNARIKDEGITRPDGYEVQINYQAYSITMAQYMQFIRLLGIIENDQKKQYHNSMLVQEPMKCYIPEDVESTNAQLTLKFRKISSLGPAKEDVIADKQTQTISAHAREIKLFNTCRTTAREIIDYILEGVGDKISRFYALALHYITKMVGGVLDKDTFYVLPAPPSLSKHAKDPTIRFVLDKLYEKLEKTPCLLFSSQITRQKFDSLKSLYNKIADIREANIEHLLDEVTTYHQDNKTLLMTHRENGIRKKFGLITNTEQVLNELIDKLKEMKILEEKKVKHHK